MVKSLIRSYLINLLALWVVSHYIDGFHLADGLKSLLLVSGGFTALHLVLKPALKVFLGGLSFLTLGLIDLVIDAGILYLLTLYFPQVWIGTWTFAGLTTPYVYLPPYEFSILATTLVSALAINVIRSALISLES